MNEPTLLQKAHAIACQAHEGQVDKGGQPYIHHPLRVAEACKTEDQKIVALLHDVVEDTDWTIMALMEYFPAHIVQAVNAITRHKDTQEQFWNYIHRCAQNPIARAVKIRDIHDNMDLSRVAGNEEMEKMIRGMTKKRYEPALKILKATHGGA